MKFKKKITHNEKIKDNKKYFPIPIHMGWKKENILYLSSITL